jgi:hypothetical protein
VHVVASVGGRHLGVQAEDTAGQGGAEAGGLAGQGAGPVQAVDPDPQHNERNCNEGDREDG